MRPMASSKRQRSTDDEVETDHSSQADDSLQSLHKRRRVSSADSEDRSSTSDVDDESLDEQESALLSQHQSQAPGRNRAADNGIIESITCTNFMCHGFLEVNLGPLINFIIGHNGSGKSAVLTALTICLGGKASSTNRGQSLKSFIKEGKDAAMLSVKIKNKGESAFQHDTFGDAIIVERHFSRSGNSAFKLKSCSGKVVSTKRSDLEEICDYFALQIDNPMNVLTQDMARQFLNNSSPQEKYKFFMKGTQLEHLDNDYLLVEQTLDTIDVEVYKKHEDFDFLQQKFHRADELYKQASQQDVMLEKHDLLGKQMAWVQVDQQESELSRREETVQQLNREITNLHSTAEGIGEAFAQVEQQVEAADRNVEKARADVTPLSIEQTALKAQHDSYENDQKAHHTDQRTITTALREAQSRVKKLEEDIENEEDRLRAIDGGRNAERRRDLQRRQEQSADAGIAFDEHESLLPRLQANLVASQKEAQAAKQLLGNKTADVKEAESRLNSLRHDRGQQTVAYSNAMPRLVQSIERAIDFREKPVGPIGTHVRLLKPKWSSILEKQFGSALESFIVTCKDDQSKLLALMQSCDCVCPIIIGNKARIDTHQYEPDPEFETWLRVLEIDNDLARNSLIISQGIDQTILLEDRANALATMTGDRLRNVKQCFTHNTRSGEGIRYGYGFGGTFSESFIPAYKGRPRMKTDIEYQINAQNQILQEMRQQHGSLESQMRQRCSDVKHCSRLISEHKSEQQRKLITKQEAQSKVEELQDLLDQDVVEEGRLDSLKEQLTDAKEEEHMNAEAYQASITAKDEVKAALARSQQKLDDLHADLSKVQSLLERAEAKSSQRHEERTRRLREKNDAIEATDAAKGRKLEREAERDAQARLTNQFREQALEFCPRVAIPAGETLTTIERKYEKIGRDLDKSREDVGDRATLSRELEVAITSRDHAHDDIEDIEKLAQLLKRTLVHRRERWRHFQRLITSRARTQFFYLLSERGFRGRLVANHKQKSLELRVEPDETRRNGAGRSTHGLSGGEKSFSTICLLLSIWEAMGAPIRCLDEFDVFMDNVNRSVSMGMMITFARNSPGKQFIFISPNSTEKKLLEDPDVKIIKMRDPERGQTRLTFAGQTVPVRKLALDNLALIRPNKASGKNIASV